MLPDTRGEECGEKPLALKYLHSCLLAGVKMTWIVRIDTELTVCGADVLAKSGQDAMILWQLQAF